ncbi:MAG: formylglycine-generating enzyme family protein [Fidelibacterota bacterium]
MNAIKYIFLSMGLLAAISAQTGSISNVIAAQRTDGSQIVDIYYDLDGGLPTYIINTKVSFDDGASFTNISLIEGDFGLGVAPGTEKHITWNFGVEYPHLYNEDTRIKITGYSGNSSSIEFVNVTAGPYDTDQNGEQLTVDYDYQIMKYEVTNLQYSLFLQGALAAGYITVSADTVYGYYQGDAYFSSGDYPYIDLSAEACKISLQNGIFLVEDGYDEFPVRTVSYMGASTFAAEYGWELPNLPEWVRAGRGNTGWSYSFGETLAPHWANYNESGDPYEPEPTPVGFYNGTGHQGYWVGDAHSPFGAYDMTGNIEEWLDHVTSGEWNGEAAGGSYFSYSWDGDLLMGASHSIGKTALRAQVGFRCVSQN